MGSHRNGTRLLHVLTVASLLLGTFPTFSRATESQESLGASVPASSGPLPAWFEPSQAAEAAATPPPPPLPDEALATIQQIEAGDVVPAGRSEREIRIERQVTPWLALPGDIVTVTLVISSGAAALANAELIEALPEPLEWLPAEDGDPEANSPAEGVGAERVEGDDAELDGPVYDAEARTLRWRGATLEAGRRVTVTYRARIDAQAESVALAPDSRANAEVVDAAATGAARAVSTTLDAPRDGQGLLLIGERELEVLGPEGGVLSTPDGRVRMHVPAGAVLSRRG